MEHILVATCVQSTRGNAAKPEATPSATKHRKKAKKSTVKLGVKTGTVK